MILLRADLCPKGTISNSWFQFLRRLTRRCAAAGPCRPARSWRSTEVPPGASWRPRSAPRAARRAGCPPRAALSKRPWQKSVRQGGEKLGLCSGTVLRDDRRGRSMTARRAERAILGEAKTGDAKKLRGTAAGPHPLPFLRQTQGEWT